MFIFVESKLTACTYNVVSRNSSLQCIYVLTFNVQTIFM